MIFQNCQNALLWSKLQVQDLVSINETYHCYDVNLKPLLTNFGNFLLSSDVATLSKSSW